MAQQVRRAAALTAELAAQSEKKTAAVCDQPPGLDELARHIEAPNMGAGGSHPQATMMPLQEDLVMLDLDQSRELCQREHMRNQRTRSCGK